MTILLLQGNSNKKDNRITHRGNFSTVLLDDDVVYFEKSKTRSVGQVENAFVLCNEWLPCVLLFQESGSGIVTRWLIGCEGTRANK